jgi:hypothetical protein
MSEEELETFLNDHFPGAVQLHWTCYVTVKNDYRFQTYSVNVTFPDSTSMSFSSDKGWDDIAKKARKYRTTPLIVAESPSLESAIARAEYAGDNLPAPR